MGVANLATEESKPGILIPAGLVAPVSATGEDTDGDIILMYRRNIADQFIGFRMISAASGSALTGLTVTVYRAIDGGLQEAATGTVQEKGNGHYVYRTSAADTNGAQVSFLFTAPGAAPIERTIVTTNANPADATRFGLTALPNAAAGSNGGLPTYGSGAYQLSPELIANTLLDLSNGIETGIPLRKALRAIAAALLGETSGSPSDGVGQTYNGIGVDTPRIVCRTSNSGNRVTIDLTLN